MRILHTADWHVGRTIRGQSRHAEHEQVLDDLVALARREAVDLVLVAGDVFDSAAPSPEAEALVWRTLLALHDAAGAVVVIAGNHDHPRRFQAIRPVMAELGITVLGEVVRPDDGGTLECTLGGERVRLALLPFCSPRHLVRAAELMELDASGAAGQYRDQVRAILEVLTGGFDADAVNVVVAHGMVRGGQVGGGEREAQTFFEDYWIDADAFGPAASYVALGHLHRTQRIPAPSPLWYPGSPLQVDFGEQGRDTNALVVEARAGVPVEVRPVPVTGGTELRTVTGTLAELAELAALPGAGATPDGDAWLRVVVTEPPRPGLAAEVRDLLGTRVVEVRVEQPRTDRPDRARPERGLAPHELFTRYLHEQDAHDPRLVELFTRLFELEVTADRDGPG